MAIACMRHKNKSGKGQLKVTCLLFCKIATMPVLPDMLQSKLCDSHSALLHRGNTSRQAAAYCPSCKQSNV